MDKTYKQDALREAVELTKSALGSPSGKNDAIMHPDDAADFLGAMYAKLCELHEDSVSA